MERHKIEPHKKTIFTKHLFIDLAKECGLNAALGVVFSTTAAFLKCASLSMFLLNRLYGLSLCHVNLE